MQVEERKKMLLQDSGAEIREQASSASLRHVKHKQPGILSKEGRSKTSKAKVSEDSNSKGIVLKDENSNGIFSNEKNSKVRNSRGMASKDRHSKGIASKDRNWKDMVTNDQDSKNKNSKGIVTNDQDSKDSNIQDPKGIVSNDQETKDKNSKGIVTNDQDSNDQDSKDCNLKDNNAKGMVSNDQDLTMPLSPDFLPRAKVHKLIREEQHLRALQSILNLISNDIEATTVCYPLPEILTRQEYYFILTCIERVNNRRVIRVEKGKHKQKDIARAIAIKYVHCKGLKLGVKILDPRTIEIEKISITKLSQTMQMLENMPKSSRDLAFSSLLLAEILEFFQTDAVQKTIDLKQFLDLKKKKCIINLITTLNFDDKVFGTRYYVDIVGDIRKAMAGVKLWCSFDRSQFSSFRLYKTFLDDNVNNEDITIKMADIAVKDNFLDEGKHTDDTDPNGEKDLPKCDKNKNGPNDEKMEEANG